MSDIPSFEELRERRVRYVESARENNFEEGLKNLLSELYPDNAHFIYELLQNAEDAFATAVEFVLDDDHLTVSHDGTRPFSLADIESITGIGNSTKRDDPTQIGKFGVGFKAVFAYTTRPEVRSGHHSFSIDDLFIPNALPGTPKEGATTFVFPFDRPDKPASTAAAEIQRGLTELDEKTLLFLHHIRTITYELPDGHFGIIERDEVDDLVITIKKSEGEGFNESRWLRLTGPASVGSAKGNQLSVAAAFRMDQPTGLRPRRGRQGNADELAKEARRTIVPLDEGDVSIYFPAVKESSGLRFHIHAPFASTVARDSVRDDPGNVSLVRDIASLIVEALPRLRAQGLLTDTFLETLPNYDDQIGHPYALIRDAVIEAFNSQKLTPVRGSSGGFAPARTLVASPSEFRRWLDQRDLPTLLELAGTHPEHPPRWIRDREGRAGRFLGDLDTVEFGWHELRQALLRAANGADEILEHAESSYGEDTKTRSKSWSSWLEAKPDEALLRFYQLIGLGYRDHHLYYGLIDVPIVRLRQRNATTHVRGSATYLPSGRSDAAQSRVPPDLAYFDDDEDQGRASNLAAFYRAVGTKRWDESARIERRLETYKNAGRSIPEGEDIGQHLDDVRSFIRYASKQGNAKPLFTNTAFLLADQSDGSQMWVRAEQTFVDVPFRDTGLSALHPRIPLYWDGGSQDGKYAYDQEPYPLSGIYLVLDGIVAFLENLGAQTAIEITKADVRENPGFSWSWRLNYRETAQGQRIDWGISKLHDIIQTRDADILRSLWVTVIAADPSKALALYQVNGSAPLHKMASQLARTLMSTPWVLNRHGDVKLPREMSLNDLPEDWPTPEPTSLIYKLDFGADAARRRQQEEGVTDFLRHEGLEADSIDLLREAKELGFTSDDFRTILQEFSAKARFPEGRSDDPVRRAAVAALDAANAPVHTTSIRPRSVVDGQSQAFAASKAYLRGQYTTPTGEMHCQACRKQLPFKTDDHLWYFEAVRFVSSREQVHTSNSIALCPLCAALYKYARGTTNDAILEQLNTTVIDAGQGVVEIPVLLDGKRVKIGFTGKHAIDIKASLGVAGSERADGA